MRLERPGIEPGAARLVGSAVDAIDTPQRLPTASSRVGGKTEILTFSNGAVGNGPGSVGIEAFGLTPGPSQIV